MTAAILSFLENFDGLEPTTGAIAALLLRFVGSLPLQALEIFRRVCALGDIRRLETELNPVNRRGRAKGDLTAREREICDLLLEGKTNKAIAEQLVLSERTVESHVSAALTKMNAASRIELIAKLK